MLWQYNFEELGYKPPDAEIGKAKEGQEVQNDNAPPAEIPVKEAPERSLPPVMENPERSYTPPEGGTEPGNATFWQGDRQLGPDEVADIQDNSGQGGGGGQNSNG